MTASTPPPPTTADGTTLTAGMAGTAFSRGGPPRDADPSGEGRGS